MRRRNPRNRIIQILIPEIIQIIIVDIDRVHRSLGRSIILRGRRALGGHTPCSCSSHESTAYACESHTCTCTEGPLREATAVSGSTTSAAAAAVVLTLLPPVVPVEVVKVSPGSGVWISELGVPFDAFDRGDEFDGVQALEAGEDVRA